VDIYGAPVFAPDFSTIVLAAKMCTNSNEHSVISMHAPRLKCVSPEGLEGLVNVLKLFMAVIYKFL
jgi:hypothetical protein